MDNIRFNFIDTSWAILLLIFSVCFIDLSPAHSGENPLIRISSERQRIIIKANAVSLPELLNKIKAQSGIDFKINDSLMNESISVDIEAVTWTEAIQEVLKGYNMVELWGRDRKLAGVYVVEVLNPEGIYFSEPSSDEEKGKTGQITANNKQAEDDEILLSKGQLVKLADGLYRSPISPDLWKDEHLREFLQQHGINSPEDLNDLKKAMTIRQTARKKLRDLRKNKPAQNESEK